MISVLFGVWDAAAVTMREACVALAFVAVATHAAAWSVADGAPPTVTMLDPACGGQALNGSWAEVPTDAGGRVAVARFLGLRYAEPPTAARRFRAPQDRSCPGGGGEPSPPSNRPVAAAAYGPMCPQLGALFASEDCLRVNVWVPAPIYRGLGSSSPAAAPSSSSSSSSLRPVVVYLHGGDLVFGSGNESPFAFYAANAAGHATGPDQRDPSSPSSDRPSASEQVVAVTVNYRLGLLGFLAHESLREPAEPLGNYGTQDMLSALRWVRRHIRTFGGDPARVTVLGQGSGATSIFAMLASPMATGLFRAAIALSGSPNTTMGAPAKLAQDAGVPATLGCGDAGPQSHQSSSSAASPSVVADCLRLNVSVATLLLRTPNAWNLNSLMAPLPLAIRSRYPGIIYVDGVVVPADPISAATRGVNRNVTLLLGTMAQEGNLEPLSIPGGVANLTSPAAFRRRLAALDAFGPWPNASGVAARVAAAYESALRGANATLALLTLGSDYGVACGYRHLALAHARGGRQTLLFWDTTTPYRPYDGAPWTLAFHGWNYFAATGQWFVLKGAPPAVADLEYSRQLRRHWYRVVDAPVDGVPLPPSALPWPAVNASLLTRGGGSVDAAATRHGGAVFVSNGTLDEPDFFLYGRAARWPFRASGVVGGPTGGRVLYGDGADVAGRCRLLDGLGLGQADQWAN